VAKKRISPAACLAELRRVAALLGRKTLTVSEFDRHAAMCGRTVSDRFGTWGRAQHQAGLTWRHNAWRTTPLPTLARAFVQAALDLGHLPNCTELERHADYERKTLSGRWGGYTAFKRAALTHLLAPETRLPVGPEVRELLAEALRRLSLGVKRGAAPPPRGPRLDFRGFRHAPTCEQGVVALFGAVAHDLGFEILHTQAAFPDCLARKNRRTHRIEFEYTSRDFRRHGHAPAGCDLIVCWRHDWPDSPLPVLELATTIKQLPAEPQRTRRSLRNSTRRS
jgi:hypothetical protein